MISEFILCCQIGVITGVLAFWIIGLRLMRWSDAKDRRDGVEPASRGCRGAVLAVLVTAAAFCLGFYLRWKGW